MAGSRAAWLLVPVMVLPWALLLAVVALHFVQQPSCRVHTARSNARQTAQGSGPRDLSQALTTPPHLLAPANCSVPPPAMAFLHLPKAGGTSVVNYMYANLNAWCEETHVPITSSFVGALKTGMAKDLATHQNRRPFPHNCSYSLLRAGPNGDARPAYAAMALGEAFKVQYVMGHLPFGFCRLVDAGCTYVTMLREPLQRLASHWGYLRHKHPDLLVRACGEACETLAGFSAALAAGTAQGVLGTLDNMQTRMIAGDGFLASLSGNRVCTARTSGCDKSAPMTNDRTMLELAKHNLVRHFRVVGLLEDLPGFTHDMEAAFCFTHKSVPGLNRLGTGSRVLNGTDPAVLEVMRATQGMDLELYDFARQLIHTRRRQRAAAAA